MKNYNTHEIHHHCHIAKEDWPFCVTSLAASHFQSKGIPRSSATSRDHLLAFDKQKDGTHVV